MTEESAIRVSRVFWVDVRRIEPNPAQPRQYFETERLQGLAQSIAENGVLQPLCVRQTGERLELISGERRLKAAVIAGLQRVPCIVLDATDRESAVYALLENIQRADLHYFEEATAIRNLIECHHLTQEEVAICLGKSQPAISNKLRLLKIPQDMRKIITESELSERHVRSLLRYDNEEDMKLALQTIIKKKMSAAQAEEFARNKKRAASASCNRVVFKDLRIFINTFHRAVEVMRSAGIDAGAQEEENDEFYIYTVKIPKTSPNKGRK